MSTGVETSLTNFPQTFRTLKAAASLFHSGSADLFVDQFRKRPATET